MRPARRAFATSASRLFLTALLATSAASSLRATAIIMPTDDQLVAKSPVIVIGTVLRSEGVERNGGIWTETNLKVETVLRGSTGSEVTIREVGGRVGRKFNVVFGSPEYQAGQRVLVFLWPTSRGDYQTRDLFAGKFLERFTTTGRRLWFRAEDVAGTSLLDRNMQELPKSNGQRDAAGFEQFVAARASGRMAQENYQVENAQFAPEISAKYSLLKDPAVYRWFRFDQGASAEWKSVGTQPGYSDGGVAELKSAIQSWTSDPQANIRYVYGGASTEKAGGLATPNGINEIAFNDPLDEIDGSWTGSGVLGRGGFNNLGTPRPWTSPSTGDAEHLGDTNFEADEIVEGNLVIQDGVAGWAGVSGVLLAELLSHELGHTLGFGHSRSSSALMSPSLMGVGPQLRDDDKQAARWLYPLNVSISSGGQPPAPSSGVNAEFQMSNDTALVNQNVAMADRSSGNPTRWNWSFGDGQDSSEQNPSHLFGTPGRYLVSLTASDGLSSSSRTKAVTVNQAGEVFRTLVPVAALMNGAGVSVWTTELTIFNSGPSSAILEIRFLSRTGGTPLSRQVELRSNETIRYANALADLFGMNQGTGALAVEATNPSLRPEIHVASRTFTSDGEGSYGQAVPDTGDYLPAVTYLTSLSSTPEFRTNIGLVNRSQSPVVATMQLRDSSGTVLDTASIPLEGNSFRQSSIAAFFPSAPEQDLSGMSVRVEAPAAGAVEAYASVIDNRSQDPVFISGRPADVSTPIVVPAVAHTPGAQGTFWKSDVTLFNPMASELTLSIQLLGVGQENGRTVSIAPSSSVTIDDVVTWLGAEGQGTLVITPINSQTAPVVTSRTYTTRESDGGTYGQAIDAVDGSSFLLRAAITGLKSEGGFRSNVGFVNMADESISIDLRLVAGDGTVTSTVVALAPRQSIQTAAAVLFPEVKFETLGGFSLEATTAASGGMFMYASMIDNRSGDPVFFGGR
ncbi:MAG: PKD domain-containing protein [Acidobacteriota bacterium]